MLLKNYIVLNLPNGNFIPKQQVDCKVGSVWKILSQLEDQRKCLQHGKKYLSGFAISQSASVTFEKKFLGRISRKVLVQ